MTPTETLVLATSVAAITWINWYFFLAGRAVTRAASTSSGPQEVAVRVDGGNSPAAVQVSAGRPVRLSFERADASPCSEEVVLPDFGIRRFLPTGKVTAIDFTPERAGTYEFTCGMGMLRGRLIVTHD